MKYLLISILMLAGCAFKDGADSQASAGRNRISGYSGFLPSDLRMLDGSASYTLIDVIELPVGDYELDRTEAVKGLVDYLYDYPIFKDTQCQGLGYAVSYEPKRRTITTRLKLVIYVNQKKLNMDHFVASAKDSVQLAIYGESGPLAEYVDLEKLPDEFVKNFLPSNQCHYICPQARVKPVRKPIFEAGRIDCTFWIYGWDGQHPTTTWTDDVQFSPAWLEQAQIRDTHLQQLQKCDAVRSNDDLRNYYQQATDGACANNTQKMMMREWYFVEQKVPYKAVVYSIENFSKVVKSTSTTQNAQLTDSPAYPISHWSN